MSSYLLSTHRANMRPRTISDEKILEVVRDCVLQEGPSVSTQTIANNLGVSQATLFKRFGNKLQLLQQALFLPMQAAKMLQLLELPIDTHDPKTQLLRMAQGMHAFFDQMVPCWSALHAAGIRPPEPTSEESPPIRARRAIENWLVELQRAGCITALENPESLSIGLIGSLQARSFRKHILRDAFMQESDESYVQDIVDFTWRGLSTKEQL